MTASLHGKPIGMAYGLAMVAVTMTTCRRYDINRTS